MRPLEDGGLIVRLVLLLLAYFSVNETICPQTVDEMVDNHQKAEIEATDLVLMRLFLKTNWIYHYSFYV